MRTIFLSHHQNTIHNLVMLSKMNQGPLAWLTLNGPNVLHGDRTLALESTSPPPADTNNFSAIHTDHMNFLDQRLGFGWAETQCSMYPPLSPLCPTQSGKVESGKDREISRDHELKILL